ncbi:hypothetical protein BV923_18640 [Pectobacterium odoriferum]|nr:hypothetical protein BV923_18640 [Pectobacterium odoriferum]
MASRRYPRVSRLWRTPARLPASSYRINLKGRWLEESGCMTRMLITVAVECARIVTETEINV